MKFLYLLSAGLLSSITEGLNIFERQASVCTWSLAPDDCICMNSVNGAISKYCIVCRHCSLLLFHLKYDPSLYYTSKYMLKKRHNR